MTINFLHERINTNLETIKKIKSNQISLDKFNRDAFTLAERSLSILDQQLTAMEKADYFDYNGTEKMKQYIEQFTMSLEMFLIQLDAKWELEMVDNVDQLIDTFKSKDFVHLISETNQMIANYINDLEKKETDPDNNRLQKLSASLAKAKLKPFLNYPYILSTVESHCSDSRYRRRNRYECEQFDNNNNANNENNNKSQVEVVLKQVKKIIDLFYSKFNYLGDPNKSKRSKIVVRPQTTSTTPEPINTTPDPYQSTAGISDYE